MLSLFSYLSYPLFSFFRLNVFVSSKFFDTQVSSVSTKELVLPLRTRCIFSRLRCNGPSHLLNFYISKVCTLVSPWRSTCNHQIQKPLISFCQVLLRTLCAAHLLATPLLSTTSRPGLQEYPDFESPMVGCHAPIPRKGLVNNNNNNSRLSIDLFNR